MTRERAYTDVHEVTTGLLVEVARMYYERYLNQAEIARAIGVSRSQVSRYLKAAHDRGIVTITINEPDELREELSARLREAFPHLKHAVVVPARVGSASATTAAVAVAGGEVLLDAAEPGDTICVGAGRTLAKLVAGLGSKPLEDVVVVQAMGNAGHEGHDIDYNAIARAVASAFGARAFHVNAPAILAPPYVAREMLSSQPSIGASIQRARTADVYVLGLGTLATDFLFVSTGLLTAQELDTVAGLAPAGDICGRFFDIRGKALSTPFDDRLIGVELTDLRKARASIAVASGIDKADALLGALRGRYITHVVTDDQVAEQVLAAVARRRRTGNG